METTYVEVTGTIKHEGVSQPKIELTRYQKGTYGWVITAGGADLPSVIASLKEADNKLRQEFPPPTGD